MKRPNLIFIMSDDHAAHAISSYGSKINSTPNIDRLADTGMRFDNCFCTNSLCAPSRAAILTGTYNHVNGVTTLSTEFDNRLTTFPMLLNDSGYQTAMIGKWHLGHGENSNPAGFDYWEILPGQGDYIDPKFYKGNETVQYKGYVTNIITDLALDWVEKRDKEKPFCMIVNHKAPHRWWIPDEKYKNLYNDMDIPEPDNLFDDYEERARPASVAEMRISRDLKPRDYKEPIPEGLSPRDRTKWLYQRYIKDYLRCIASVDDSVGRILDSLEQEGIRDDTIVVYTSDQGFFLGDHGWYDKRFMYEESARMPFLISYPRFIQAGSSCNELITNVDFAETFLDLCNEEIPENMQGQSFKPLLTGKTPKDWPEEVYYRYWEHLTQHNVYSHYGIRTKTHKLIYYYSAGCNQPGAHEDNRRQEWELFDLTRDPREMHNIYNDPSQQALVDNLKVRLKNLQDKIGDKPYTRIHPC